MKSLYSSCEGKVPVNVDERGTRGRPETSLQWRESEINKDIRREEEQWTIREDDIGKGGENRVDCVTCNMNR